MTSPRFAKANSRYYAEFLEHTGLYQRCERVREARR
jgi:hypothetical protein